MNTKEKINSVFAKLPFKGLAEKIPEETRAKIPILSKAIPYANQIVCVIAVVLIVTVAACSGKKGSGGVEANAEAGKMLKGSGKNYTLSKDSDFKYDLTKIDGNDYVVIQAINLPKDFKKPEEIPTGEINMFGYGVTKTILKDTLTINIPEKIEGYTVGAIEPIGEKYITSVTIPDSVIELRGSILRGAFSNSSISSIKLPKNLKKIGERAFGNCTNLGGSITIPSEVTEICGSTFIGTGISEVIIPDSVNFIAEYAFADNKELTSVKLPSRPMQYMFWDVDEKKYFTSKKGDAFSIDINEEDHNAFQDCPKLSLATRNAIRESGYKGKF